MNLKGMKVGQTVTAITRLKNPEKGADSVKHWEEVLKHANEEKKKIEERIKHAEIMLENAKATKAGKPILV